VDFDLNRELASRLVEHLIRERADSLHRLPEFRGDETNSVINSLFIALFRAAQSFDPDRASFPTFAARVLDNAAASLLRARRRLKRRGNIGLESIDAPRDAGDPSAGSLSESITEADRLRASGRQVISWVDDLIRRISVAEVLASLSPIEAELCRAVLDGRTLDEIETLLGRSRDWVWRARRRLQQRFIDAGLGPEA
jgi:RNA polymerase sigma factor (sigma-70 family)